MSTHFKEQAETVKQEIARTKSKMLNLKELFNLKYLAELQRQGDINLNNMTMEDNVDYSSVDSSPEFKRQSEVSSATSKIKQKLFELEFKLNQLSADQKISDLDFKTISDKLSFLKAVEGSNALDENAELNTIEQAIILAMNTQARAPIQAPKPQSNFLDRKDSLEAIQLLKNNAKSHESATKLKLQDLIKNNPFYTSWIKEVTEKANPELDPNRINMAIDKQIDQYLADPMNFKGDTRAFLLVEMAVRELNAPAAISAPAEPQKQEPLKSEASQAGLDNGVGLWDLNSRKKQLR